MSATATEGGALSRADRRKQVRHLADQGNSARTIGAMLGVGKDTVRRDLEALSQEAPPDTEPAQEDAPPALQPARAAAPPEAPDPPRGALVELDIDDQLRQDLDTMTLTGMTEWEAVAHAVSIVAGTYRNAWAMKQVPDGVAPTITHCTVIPPGGPTDEPPCEREG